MSSLPLSVVEGNPSLGHIHDLKVLDMMTGVRLKEKSKKFAKIIRGVNGATRIGILYLLSHKPMEAHAIASNIDVPENLVSHHLKQMLISGWVNKTRIGRAVTYELDEKIFKTIVKFFEDTPLGQEYFPKKSLYL